MQSGKGGASVASTLGHLVLRADGGDTTTPPPPLLVILVGAVKQRKQSELVRSVGNLQVGLGGADESSELLLVLLADIGDSENGSHLVVNDSAKTGLVLDDHVGDAHLAAERGQVDNEFDRIDVVGDDDKVGLLRLDEGYDVVETEFHKELLLGILRSMD